MDILMLIGLAILPPLILFILTWVLDNKNDREPFWLLAILFVGGAISCFPIGISELILEMFNFFEEGSVIYAFVDMFLIVAICEEVGKFIILFLLTWWTKHFNYRYDAILYSVCVSLGFATLENVLYVLSNHIEEGIGLQVALMRALMAIPGHFTWAVIMGFFYGLAKHYMVKKETSKCIGMIALGLIIPIFAHGFYDFCLMVGIPLLVIVLIFFILFVDISTFVLLHFASKNDKPIIKFSALNNWLMNQNLGYNPYVSMNNNIQMNNRPIQPIQPIGQVQSVGQNTQTYNQAQQRYNQGNQNVFNDNFNNINSNTNNNSDMIYNQQGLQNKLNMNMQMNQNGY